MPNHCAFEPSENLNRIMKIMLACLKCDLLFVIETKFPCFRAYFRYANYIDGAYLTLLSDPASQWYLAGTDFHCLARATMAPASSTPKPNKWLNSRPTPFIFQWNRPLESNREFLLEVSTVRCCISRQVSLGLKKIQSSIAIETQNYSLCSSTRFMEGCLHLMLTKP